MTIANKGTKLARSILAFSSMSLGFGLTTLCSCKSDPIRSEPTAVQQPIVPSNTHHTKPSTAPDPSEAKRENPPPQDPVHGVSVSVQKVTDGDTFVARSPRGEIWKVRLKGFDCPEVRVNPKCKRDGEAGRLDCETQIPLGKAASLRARELLTGVTVSLEGVKPGPLESDRYGRLLAYVRLPDGRDFGAVMVAETACEDFGWRYPHPRSPIYKSLDR